MIVYFFSYNGDSARRTPLSTLLDDLALSGVDRSIRTDIEMSVGEDGWWIGDIGGESTVIEESQITRLVADDQVPIPA